VLRADRITFGYTLDNFYTIFQLYVTGIGFQNITRRYQMKQFGIKNIDPKVNNFS